MLPLVSLIIQNLEYGDRWREYLHVIAGGSDDFVSRRARRHLQDSSSRDGGERRVAVEDFVTGNNRNVLQPGDLLRSIDLPASALRKLSSFRRISLTHLGRSAALLVGTLDPRDGVFMLTVSASTERPRS